MNNNWFWIAFTGLLIMVTLAGLLVFVSYSCSKENNSRTPIVATTFISNISTATASVGGEVKYDQGSEVISRGICWSEKPTPTILDAISNNGKGSGSYVSHIKGLKANTIYYIRAFATNTVGVGYGEVVSLKTIRDLETR
jgi:hypothetical protein